jgi:acetyltransferase-like isoleucine patch superfamily enzyme
VSQRRIRFIGSILDPRNWLHLVKMVHYYSYTHVAPLRAAEVGSGAAIAPTTSFRSGRNIQLGKNVHLGERVALWAGPVSRIELGDDALLGPDVYITTSNYNFDDGTPVRSSGRIELDVVVGADCWLGARVIVLPGVTIGAGSIVGAGSVVTKSLPPGSVAVGNPARILRARKNC